MEHACYKNQRETLLLLSSILQVLFLSITGKKLLNAKFLSILWRPLIFVKCIANPSRNCLDLILFWTKVFKKMDCSAGTAHPHSKPHYFCISKWLPISLLTHRISSIQHSWIYKRLNAMSDVIMCIKLKVQIVKYAPNLKVGGSISVMPTPTTA